MPRRPTGARRRRLPRPSVPVASPADDLLLTADLEGWAGATSVRQGRQDALLGRLESLRLASDGKEVAARVRGNRTHPHEVRVSVRTGSLETRCECDFEGPVCRHAVAAVVALRFPRTSALRAGVGTRIRKAGRTARGRGRIVTPAPVEAGTFLAGPDGETLSREERIDVARQEEIDARRERARRERARVEPLEVERGPVSFRVRGRNGGGVYTVSVHGSARLATCTCPDYEKNELALCKHIERVRARLKRKKSTRSERSVSVFWQPREWPLTVPDPLREIRVSLPSSAVPGSLSRYVDEVGGLRPPPEGGEAASWLEEALAAARAEAKRRRCSWVVDPRVDAWREAFERKQALESSLGAVTRESTLWRQTLSKLGLKLHPYQEEGALFLARKGRAFLADDMGLGKTAQAIVASLLLRRTADAARALVVCPASLKYQWRREIDKVCGESATVVEGSRPLRQAAYEHWDSGFLIVNYELVLRDLEVILGVNPDLVILDEAQRIKNWDTKTAKAVKRLDSPHAFILTGTPLENRLVELHSLVEFLHPRALGPRWRLLPFHAATDTSGRVIAYEGLDVLRRRLSSFFLRRERRKVLDQLPPRTDNTFWTELTTAQRRLYRRHAFTVSSLLAKGRHLGPGEVRTLLQALTRMRILCNAGAQYAWGWIERRIADPAPPTPGEIRALHSPKLEEFAHVLDDLLDSGPTKVVVFSQWERMVRLAEFVARGILAERGETSAIFHGGLNARARGRVLDAFREDPEVRVLYSTDAGGLGLNLQESASIVVNLEVPWNPAVLEQRIGRVHRLGQRRSVQVLHFVTRGAIEERVRMVVEGKRALFEGLLSDDADQISMDAEGRASFLEKVRSLVG